MLNARTQIRAVSTIWKIGIRIGRKIMRIWSNGFLAAFYFCVAVFLGSAAAHAQTVTGSPSLALKSGESTEVGNVYWVSNCKSLLKSTPEAEVLDGPPGVAVTIKEAMVLPRI